MSRRPRRWWRIGLAGDIGRDAGKEGVIALAAEFLFIVFSDRKIFLKNFIMKYEDSIKQGNFSRRRSGNDAD